MCLLHGSCCIAWSRSCTTGSSSAERLHRGVIQWLPSDLDRIVEVGAGTGRLTLELLGRAREVVAIEPARPLRELLARKLKRIEHGDRARVTPGFFDDLPLPDDWSDLVVACSAFTPRRGAWRRRGPGGDGAGLQTGRLRRDCLAGQVDWLAARGYRYVSFDRGHVC